LELEMLEEAAANPAVKPTVRRLGARPGP